MGMYDTVYFTEAEAPLGRTEWQTKDLYNSLYRLLVKDGQLYYIDLNDAKHLLPLSFIFEIHDWDSKENKSYSMRVSVEKGKLLGVLSEGPTGGYFPLPEIPAMLADAVKTVEGMEHTISWLKSLQTKQTWKQRLTNRWIRAREEWRQAAYHIANGFKKLFGVK